MIKLTKEEVAKKAANLPADLKKATQSIEVAKELRDILKKHELHIDQAGTVADIVELTLLGAVLSREFISLMGEALPELPRDKILALAGDINNKIFAPVRESLRNIENEATTLQNGENIPVGEKPAISEIPLPSSIPSQIVSLEAHKIEAVKLSGTTTSPQANKDISYENRDTRLKMIPDDAKTKINSDPYKEPI